MTSRDALRLDSLKPRSNTGFWFYIFTHFFRLAGEKCLENLGSFGAESRAESRDEARENERFPLWQGLLDKIRTYFRENPDAEF